VKKQSSFPDAINKIDH
jgi:hypothetical protein